MLFNKEKTPSEWPDRMKLYSVLATTKSLLESASPEMSFYGHETNESQTIILSAIQYYLFPEDSPFPEELDLQFAPTGALQEISMSNGWDKVYLKLAETYDATKHTLLEKI